MTILEEDIDLVRLALSVYHTRTVYPGCVEAFERIIQEKETPTPMTIEMRCERRTENVSGVQETGAADAGRQEALDALTFVCRTLGWLEVVPTYGDAVSRTEECDKAIKLCKTIRAALQSPRVDPKPKEECEKFALIEIRLNDDGTYKYSRSGAMRCSDILKCINYHCGVNEMQSPRVPVIDGLDDLLAWWDKYYRDDKFRPMASGEQTQKLIEVARAYAELQKGV